jgi:sulfur-carrier protein
MVRVEFLGPIQKEPMHVDAASLAELSDILKAEEGLSQWLATSAVAVNDTLVSSLDTVLQDGDRVSLLPPVCGG